MPTVHIYNRLLDGVSGTFVNIVYAIIGSAFEIPMATPQCFKIKTEFVK
jgi:hypothetical protein